MDPAASPSATSRSVLTRPLNGRAACHYCGQCNRGCSTGSNFSTPAVLLPPALATGRLKLVTGAMVREVGTSPSTSVLNEWCQAHDCKNLFVADSGPFVSNAHKNMTRTILALAMRTSERIVEKRRKGNLA